MPTRLSALLAVALAVALFAAGYATGRAGDTVAVTSFDQREEPLDAEALRYTPPDVVTRYRVDSAAVETVRVVVPVELAGLDGASPGEEASPREKASPREEASPPTYSRPVSGNLEIAQDLALQGLRFVTLPLNDRGEPAVDVTRRRTVVQAYSPAGAGLTFRYDHPTPSWGIWLDGGLQGHASGLALADVRLNVRWKALTLHAGAAIDTYAEPGLAVGLRLNPLGTWRF